MWTDVRRYKMFLNLDKKYGEKVAAIDCSGAQITYGDLCAYAQSFGKAMPERTLIFVLAKNMIGSLLGYTSALINHVVPLVISANTEKTLFDNLFETYQPEYLWLPEEMVTDEYALTDYGAFGYVLVKTKYFGEAQHKLHLELSLLLPTSGSTGSPKLVRHSYRNIEANAENVKNLFGLTEDERPMVVLPMHYTMGLSVIASHLYTGATLLLCDKSMLDKEFWTMMKELQATSFTGVPYSYELLSKVRFFRMDLPYLKTITQGGGKMTPELFTTCAEYAERTGKRFIATYGQTECTARMAYLPAELAMTKIGSIGIAEPGGQLSIVDNEGKETFEGEATGEMVYRGENVTMGYATCKEDLSKGDENHGIMYTGDLARRDADGCYFIIGRLKRFLKIYGLRIGLDEIENIIKSNLKIDCYCSGSDEKLVVYITDERMSEQVIELVEEKTHLFHQNIEIKVVPQILRNEAGKVIMQ